VRRADEGGVTWVVLVWLALIAVWMAGDRLGVWGTERPATPPRGHRRVYAAVERLLGTRVERP
jgi:hypothetical protein